MTDQEKLVAIKNRIDQWGKENIQGLYLSISAIQDIKEIILSTPSVPDHRKSMEGKIREVLISLWQPYLEADFNTSKAFNDAIDNTVKLLQTYRDQEVSAAVEEEKRNVVVLMGLLGYPVPSDTPNTLSDGTTATNGLFIPMQLLQSDLSAANQTIAEKDREIERLKAQVDKDYKGYKFKPESDGVDLNTKGIKQSGQKDWLDY